MLVLTPDPSTPSCAPRTRYTLARDTPSTRAIDATSCWPAVCKARAVRSLSSLHTVGLPPVRPRVLVAIARSESALPGTELTTGARTREASHRLGSGGGDRPDGVTRTCFAAIQRVSVPSTVRGDHDCVIDASSQRSTGQGQAPSRGALVRHAASLCAARDASDMKRSNVRT